ncbi:14872_t:CDS:2 [Dentiscutata heterogama]|uniref:14872_t:CDS:1 n=1 Tax=Dentiscutata heterogama TaxID=1316150 RepID=A0ACA9KR95_9GLOM|nr:14872_t:CDS:2 [Dentiscutata heterogama]
MASKYLTLLTILVLFLSALGSSAEPIKRQDSSNCVTTSTTSFTYTATPTPGCTVIAMAPTITAVVCGNCNSSGPSGPGGPGGPSRSEGFNFFG